MPERTLIARIRPDEGEAGTLVVASPVVGLALNVAKAGTFLDPLDRVLTIRIVGRQHVLRMPRDVQGRVVEVLIPDALVPVAFNQGLMRLDPQAAAAAASPSAAAQGPGGSPPSETANVIVVTAPSEGIFYRRPSPDAPHYTHVGAGVSVGAVLGLIEVMKCFNQIAYGGPGLPERGEVVKILAEDASEIQFGQPLFWIRPSG